MVKRDAWKVRVLTITFYCLRMILSFVVEGVREGVGKMHGGKRVCVGIDGRTLMMILCFLHTVTRHKFW